MSLKMLREDLCRRQVREHEWPPSIASAVDVLINMIDRHRPLGPDGKHGDLHTSTCGCEDLAATAAGNPPNRNTEPAPSALGGKTDDHSCIRRR